MKLNQKLENYYKVDKKKTKMKKHCWDKIKPNNYHLKNK